MHALGHTDFVYRIVTAWANNSDVTIYAAFRIVEIFLVKARFVWRKRYESLFFFSLALGFFFFFFKSISKEI